MTKVWYNHIGIVVFKIKIPIFLSYFGKSFYFVAKAQGGLWLGAEAAAHVIHTDFASKIVGILWSKIIGDDWLYYPSKVSFSRVWTNSTFLFPLRSYLPELLLLLATASATTTAPADFCQSLVLCKLLFLDKKNSELQTNRFMSYWLISW